MMNVYGSSEEHQPVTYLRGYPIYAAHFIVLVYSVSMVVTAILGPSGAFLFAWLPFNNAAVWKGEIWRIFTYGMVNVPSIPFVVDMLMIVWFGRDVEKLIGRRKFLGLYAGIYLLPPLLLTTVTPWLPATHQGEFGALAIFVAFATFYPGVPLMFNVLAKWAAIILVGIFTLMALAARNWSWLTMIWVANGFAFAFTRYQQGHFTLPKLRFPTRKPNLRVLPDLPAKNTPSARPPENSMAEVDALLDKIARSGIASLTAKERAKLDAARDDLKKKTSSRH
jgi:membrane associated rhomboid family serine protease